MSVEQRQAALESMVRVADREELPDPPLPAGDRRVVQMCNTPQPFRTTP
jgi:hypothetical protein